MIIKNLADFIFKRTNRKNIFILILLIVCIEVLFNILLPGFTEKTGNTIIDMSPAITKEDAYSRLESVDMAKKEYFYIRLIDFIFPAVYAITFSVVSCGIYRKKYSNIDNYKWILIVPIIGAISDYIENIILVLLRLLLPIKIPVAIYVLNFFIIIKFLFICISILLIITGLLALLKGGDSSFLMGNKFRGPQNGKE